MRGSALIMACKILSLFLSPANLVLLETDDTETIFSILGYLFHPGTIVFGPWVSFGAYAQSIHEPIFSITSIVAPILPAGLCLITSTCLFSMFPSVPGYSVYQAIIETYSFHARQVKL